MKKVLIYTDCFYFSGCENMLPVLLKHQNLNDHFDISLSYRHSTKYESGLRGKLDFRQHKIFPLKLSGFAAGNSLIDKVKRRLSSAFELPLMLYDLKVLVSHFQTLRPEVILINNGGYPGARTCRSAVIAARIAKIRHVYFYVNNIAEPYDRLARYLQFPVDCIITRGVTKFATASEYARQKLLETLRLRPDDVLCIRNAFDGRSVQTLRQDVRRQYLKDQHSLLIGCVGEFAGNKGQQYLLEAIETLCRKYKAGTFKLILLGEGTAEHQYREYIAEHRLSDFVEIVPYQSNVFDYYNAMDIYVQPSIASDDLPFAVREAMSAGLPIIASDFAGIPELITDGLNGRLVSPGDSDALAKAISYLVEHEPIRRAYGDASRRIYRERLCPQAVIGAYHKLLNGDFL